MLRLLNMGKHKVSKRKTRPEDVTVWPTGDNYTDRTIEGGLDKYHHGYACGHLPTLDDYDRDYRDGESLRIVGSLLDGQDAGTACFARPVGRRKG